MQRARELLGLDARVVRLEPATRGETDRELGVGCLKRRAVMHRHERREHALDRIGPETLVQTRRASVALLGARPLDATELLEARVRHARVHRRQRAQLVPDVLAGRVVPIEAKALGQLREDPLIVHGLARRVERLAHALDAALGVRDGAVGLAPRGRARQDHVGELGGLRREDVLHDEKVEAAEQAADAGRIGIGLGRVLTDDVAVLQFPGLHAVEHLREVPAVAIADRHAVGLRELLAGLVVVLDVLEARQTIRDRAHVAAALNVVLATQRVEARAVPTNVATDQRQRDQAEDVVDARVVLGDAERPRDHRAIGLGVGVGDLADRLGRHAG